MNSFIGGFYGCIKVCIRTVESGVFTVNIVFFGYGGFTIGDSGIDCADKVLNTAHKRNLGIQKPGFCRSRKIGVCVQFVIRSFHGGFRVVHCVDVLLNRFRFRFRNNAVSERTVHIVV